MGDASAGRGGGFSYNHRSTGGPPVLRGGPAMSQPFGIERFLNVRSASAPAFSPDGRFVAFLTNVTGVTQVWQVPVAGGWPQQITFTRESVRSVSYHPTRPQLVFGMDAGGNERTQLYLVKGVAGGDHDLGDGWDVFDLAV